MVDTTDFDTYLRKSLAQALRKERYGRLCRSEPSDFSHSGNILSQILTWWMVVSLAFWLFIRVDLSIWQAAGVVAGLLLVLAGFAGATKRFGTALLIIFFLWIASGVASYRVAGSDGLLVTHVVPLGVVLIAAMMWSAISLASRIPVLLPVAVIVVFLPLLTQDLWVVGDAVGLQLIAVAAVALGPPLLFLGARFSKTDVKRLFAEVTAPTSEGSLSRREILQAIKEAPRTEEKAEPPEDAWLWGRLHAAYENAGDFSKNAEEMAGDIGKTFTRHCTFRLIRLVIGITAFFGAFVYLLAWAAIPISTSTKWIGHPVDTTTLGLADWQISIPTTPYISVAMLLAVVAGAAFAAFALTEERYSNALSDVLIYAPAKRCVTLGVPYKVLFPDKTDQAT